MKTWSWETILLVFKQNKLQGFMFFNFNPFKMISPLGISPWTKHTSFRELNYLRTNFFFFKLSTYRGEILEGTNDIYFKISSMNNEWPVCPPFFLEIVIHFKETKFILNLHRLNLCMHYILRFFELHNYFLLFIETP